MDPEPLGLAVGETYRPGSYMGTHLMSTVYNGQTLLMVGALAGTPAHSTKEIDNGTVYVFPVPPGSQ